MALTGAGVLGPGQAEHFDVVLQSGVMYAVHVSPVEKGVDFDLYIYDENGNLVQQDVTTSSDALCVITPRWTGPFRMIVKSAQGFSLYNIRIES